MTRSYPSMSESDARRWSYVIAINAAGRWVSAQPAPAPSPHARLLRWRQRCGQYLRKCSRSMEGRFTRAACRGIVVARVVDSRCKSTSWCP